MGADGGADYLEETLSVCGRGCESERKRELATEREIEREEERGREGSFVSINGL